MNGITDKLALRARMNEKRDGLDEVYKQTQSEKICNSLIKWLDQSAARHIHVYIPIGSEVNILSFIQYGLDRGVHLYTSRTMGNRKLEHGRIRELTQMKKGRFGTLSPHPFTPYDGSFDTILVPGLVFDLLGNRIGYGGGYYDIFLAEQAEALKIGICYPLQIIERIVTESFDIPVDHLISS